MPVPLYFSTCLLAVFHSANYHAFLWFFPFFINSNLLFFPIFLLKEILPNIKQPNLTPAPNLWFVFLSNKFGTLFQLYVTKVFNSWPIFESNFPFFFVTLCSSNFQNLAQQVLMASLPGKTRIFPKFFDLTKSS